MSAKEIKALERRLYEEYNKGKAAVLAVIDELYATDTVQHSSTGEDILGIKVGFLRNPTYQKWLRKKREAE